MVGCQYFNLKNRSESDSSDIVPLYRYCYSCGVSVLIELEQFKNFIVIILLLFYGIQKACVLTSKPFLVAKVSRFDLTVFFMTVIDTASSSIFVMMGGISVKVQ